SIIFELVVVCTGYSLTLRLFDSQIRTVNPLVWGWVVTLACYEPFNHVTFGQIANRYVGEPWYEMIQSYPSVTLPWLLGLLVSYVVWVWATCSFGLRWSNLTNRGVVTCGPYKYLKHPDYFSKSIFFWLTAMPFLADATLTEKIVATIALLTVNGLYYARARAEEVHMSEDPDYVRYALVMNEKSLLRFLGKAFPPLLYRSPK
ncbi:MAG: isoprenylcysteine carboxylmethyltransferase family protein, partial [Planktomarina sp.]